MYNTGRIAKLGNPMVVLIKTKYLLFGVPFYFEYINFFRVI